MPAHAHMIIKVSKCRVWLFSLTLPGSEPLKRNIEGSLGTSRLMFVSMAYHYSLARSILVDEYMVRLSLSKYTKRGYLCTCLR